MFYTILKEGSNVLSEWTEVFDKSNKNKSLIKFDNIE